MMISDQLIVGSLTPAEELEAFILEQLPLHQNRWGNDDGFAARCDWQRRLHSGRWAALAWPVEHGGRGLAVVDQVECECVLARHGAPVSGGILGINNVGPTLMALGTDEQKRHLPAILSTDQIWCQGFSEPSTGSDLAGVRTRAVIEGDEFVIDGQKIWTTSGVEATHCELMVRTDPSAVPAREGLSVLIVPMDLPGIIRNPIRQIDGTGDFAEVFFDGVRVPRSALLGELNGGWDVIRATLAYERSAVVSLAGRLREQVDLLVDDVRNDAIDESTMLSVVDCWIEAQSLGIHGERVLSVIGAGQPPGPEQSVIKLAWSQITQRIGEVQMELQGTAAVAPSPAAAKAYLRSRSATIAGGTTEVMKNMIADRVLRLPRS